MLCFYALCIQVVINNDYHLSSYKYIYLLLQLVVGLLLLHHFFVLLSFFILSLQSGGIRQQGTHKISGYIEILAKGVTVRQHV